jgi:alpha-glucosidase (family GH31 glycosyl hydrolase)
MSYFGTNSLGRRMYIPRGQWYNYWTNSFVTGGKEIWVDTKFDEIPVFVKGCYYSKISCSTICGRVRV